MKESEKEYTPMRKVLERMGGKSSLVQDTRARLKAQGVEVSISLIYKTINGEVQRNDVAEAFLQAAEQTAANRRQLEDRARQLIAEN